MTPTREVELKTLKMKEESLAPGSSFSMRGEPTYDEEAPPRYWSRFVDGFRRDPHSVFFAADSLEGGDQGGRVHDGAHYYDLQSAMQETANSGLARKLKGRHLQMIAIGGSIGMCPHWYGKAPRQETGVLTCAKNRHWSIRRIWKSSSDWRSGITTTRLLDRRHHALLHVSGSGRTRSHLSHCRFLFSMGN